VNTAEGVVLSAIEKGFDTIGFSGHGYTPFDTRYCMMDTQAYIAHINFLKQKYTGKIEIVLGCEEDAHHLVNRNDYEYIIGSCHFFCIDGVYYPIDSGIDYFNVCLKAFHGDGMALAEHYYRFFCDYIMKRKPDIIGHFDLITKFDERYTDLYLNNPEYMALARRYLREAMRSDCLFEVNTGAISRGYRNTPYPSEDLLYTLYKNDGKIVLSSDSHAADSIDYCFDETRTMLRGIGFQYAYTFHNGEFSRYLL